MTLRPANNNPVQHTLHAAHLSDWIFGQNTGDACAA
jgi:hypothetical protein